MKLHLNPFVHPKKMKADDNGDFLTKGYSTHPMHPQQPLEYPSEHDDEFYGMDGGFCERNNYLDRN